MGKPSIQVENVSKKFGLSLKNALRYGLTDSLRRMIGRGKNPMLREGEFWALKDINFSLYPGDALGIMGINGSGKTTLLRILNGTYSPDKGKVTIRGRVGALIAAGAGFSPMLTGRENVFISGSLLGMKPAEIRKRFDEIVDFADLEEFIDMPVRNYSSGMAVRLGFSVAVLGNPDILLVDEVLAVGDINFQKKCYERIHDLKNQGTTILLVAHSLGAIWNICDKGLVIHHGRTEGIISVEQACRHYEQFNNAERIKKENKKDKAKLSNSYDSSRCGTGDAFITQLEILDKNTKKEILELNYAQSFIIRLHITAMKQIPNVLFRISLDSEIYKSISIIDSYEISSELYTMNCGKYTVDFEVKTPNIRPGVYSFTPSICNKDIGVHIYLEHKMKSVMIKHPNDRFLYADPRAAIFLDAVWDIQREDENE